jgi:hypothetical protein
MMLIGNDRTSATESIRTLVLETITAVATEQGKTLGPMSDEIALMNSGLDSLCVAIVVARLDDRLGVDPFGTADDVMLPVTLGDFVQIYEHATT